MKKLILGMIVMFSLMSFTTKNEDIRSRKVLFSPWCFEYADGFASAWSEDNPTASYEDEYNTFLQEYDDCESKTNNPQFQFPN